MQSRIYNLTKNFQSRMSTGYFTIIYFENLKNLIILTQTWALSVFREAKITNNFFCCCLAGTI